MSPSSSVSVEAASHPSLNSAVETQTNKTPAHETQASETQAYETQAHETQAHETQAHETQTRKADHLRVCLEEDVL